MESASITKFGCNKKSCARKPHSTGLERSNSDWR